MKKKILLWLYAIMLIALVLTGCKKSDVGEKGHSQPTETSSVAASSETTSEEMQVTDVDEPETTEAILENTPSSGEEILESGEYNSKEDVALYIYTFGHLPDNYLTKKEATALGYVSSEGNLWDVAPGKSIGGDKFGNREGLLPKKKGRQYYECDIDFDGGFRNGKRIVFSNDGLVYYTEDHYATFDLLYGEE